MVELSTHHPQAAKKNAQFMVIINGDRPMRRSMRFCFPKVNDPKNGQFCAGQTGFCALMVDIFIEATTTTLSNAFATCFYFGSRREREHTLSG